MNFFLNNDYDINDDLILDDYMQYENYNINENKNNKRTSDFRHIQYNNLSLKNSLLKKIDKETKNIEKYFFKKIEEFPKIFPQKNLSSLEQTINYLESISIPSKCICAGIIDTIPGWRCVECSIYENSIYCSNCYFNSKEIHKNHKVEFLNSSGGMCDCGDPDSLYSFCAEHRGPYTKQEEIDEYIKKVFNENDLKNIKNFFDDFFNKFSNYLILTEKCKLFYDDILEQNKNQDDSKINITNLKSNFEVVFKNFMDFLRMITEKNLAMLNIMASYFLKNNFDKNNKEQGLTTHSCIKISENNIEILYKDKNANKNILSSMNFSGITKHKCECPFLRLFISNYRSNIKPLDVNETEDEKFFLSFTHNLFLRKAMCIILFFLYKEVLLNHSNNIIYVRNQYFMEDALVTIVEKSELIEDSYDFFYEYVKNYLEKHKFSYDLGIINKDELDKFLINIRLYMYDSKYLSKPKVRQLMLSKDCIYIKLIDILCLFHNQLFFKSIVPHPQFQAKKEIIELVDAELFILNIASMTIFYTDWENINKIKDIFNYFVDKIIFLKKNSKLEKDEYTFHIPLYKFFGVFINNFCLNYALNNNTNLYKAIEFVKSNLFRSKKEMNQIINIILDEYYKFFGFTLGIRNGFFNYYEIHNYNFVYFNDMRYLTKDFILLKYLIAMLEEPLNINYIIEKTNVENTYSIFKSIFGQVPNPQSKNNSNENEQNVSGFFGFLRHPIISITNYFSKKNPFKKKTDETEENNFTMHWRRFLEMIITILKNDSTILSDTLISYDETISLKTKNIFYEKIKKNKYLMQDCRYMLKQSLIHTIIANGNLMDLEQIHKTINKFYLSIFDDKEFSQILDEVTFNKTNGEKKQFFIKDSMFKYLDMNYYFSPMIRSKAELYINDFKKDMFKMYHSYYYSPSEFTFDFYNKAYENVFLSTENIELFRNALEILLNPVYEDKMKKYDANNIRAVMLPVIFNFLSMFGSINSALFYNFKLNNENLIANICKILNNVINANKENNFLDSELADNIVEVNKQLNSYKTIRGFINDGIIKLKNKSYNTDEEELRINLEKSGGKNNINLTKIESKEEEKKNKLKNMKDKLKNKMKSKSDKFINKAKKNKDMKEIIDTKEKKEDINVNDINKENEEIMCFYCRNLINLNSFEKPYGKLGLIVDDYFYDNSITTTLNSELNHIIENESNNLIKESSSNIIKNLQANRKKNYRISSCGHYFHQTCFNNGKTYNGFKCPLCEKIQNILIPPLNNFYKKESFLKPPILKLKDIFSKENIMKNNNNIIMQDDFKYIIINFLNESACLDLDYIDSQDISLLDLIQNLLKKYQSFINFLINLIYSNAITFHKHQQILIIKNLFLSLRYLIYINYINIDEITKHVQQLIEEIQFTFLNDFLPNDVDYFNKKFDELLICFCILFDYNEIKNSFIFLINLILPYIGFFAYLKSLVIKNNLYTLGKDSLENMSLDNLKKYLNENNTEIINHFIKFLHRFYIIKLTTNFENNDDKITHNLKNLSDEELFSILNIEKLYQSLSKNDRGEIIFSDLFKKIPELLSSFDYYNNIKDLLIDYNEIFDSLINQSKKTENKISKLVEPNFIIQFIPYEFKLISLDNQIFDFFEKYVFKKCIMCNNEVKYYFICIVCGQKICATNSCDKSSIHVRNCSGKMGMFIYIGDMKLYIINSENKKKILFPLYVNESGVGPDLTNKGREFKLSKENYETALKEFISLDIKM